MNCDGFCPKCNGVNAESYNIKRPGRSGYHAATLCAECVDYAKRQGFEVVAVEILKAAPRRG